MGSNDEVMQLARTILRTAEIRENSYDLTSAEKEVDNKSVTDFGEFYKISLNEAADKSCKEMGYDTRMTQFIYLAMLNWNDVIGWAENIVIECDKIVDNKKYKQVPEEIKHSCAGCVAIPFDNYLCNELKDGDFCNKTGMIYKEIK